MNSTIKLLKEIVKLLSLENHKPTIEIGKPRDERNNDSDRTKHD